MASCCREAHTDDELWACARLRAQCFYAYPPEREFAGKVHRLPALQLTRALPIYIVPLLVC